jgi:hypothetical protein
MARLPIQYAVDVLFVVYIRIPVSPCVCVDIRAFLSCTPHSTPTSTCRPRKLSILNNPSLTLQQVKEAETSTTSEENGQEIYLGFEKYDTAPRAGRKGKVIKDDPRKYPAKDNMGWFLGVTGGWAGGEAALVKIREEAEVGAGCRHSDKLPGAAAWCCCVLLQARV